jgi:thiol-disulfide isomerase/thioredoxin
MVVGAGAVVAAVWVKQGAASPAMEPLTPGGGVKIEFTDKPLPVPAFALTDLSGKRVAEDTGRGKVVLINFWATWCGPCLLEAPELVDLAEEYKDRINIIGVSTDDTPEQIRQFAQANKIGYPLLVGRDREDVASAFGLGAGIPMTVFVKADGTILSRLNGINTKEFFRARIQSLF